MTLFFTADQHFGHQNIIQYCNRPFDDSNHQTDELVEKWNERVGERDQVYVMGDFSFGGWDETLRIVYQLNGSIIVTPGGHDYGWSQHLMRVGHWGRYTRRWSYNISATKTLAVAMPTMETNAEAGWIGEFVGGWSYLPIILSHHAHRVWSKSHYGSWHLFGHSHGNLAPHGMSFDVGVDAWGYYPLSLDEVAEQMRGLKERADYVTQVDGERILD